ncbi:MAG: phage tail protein, partial [Acetobacteraceae bacterium]|nr:phage tail protein [Acetobacteraceae bacterium]
MPITQAGTLNTTALVVPDLYVQIVPPQQLVLNGVPTNMVGVVGTAAWGPVNQPAIVGTMQDYARLYGAIQPRQYDMGTQVATAVQQGASNFRCVRVTDGTDTAATYGLFYANGAYPLLLAARYTGSLGNQITLTLSQLSNGGWRLTLGLPGQVAEVFDVAAGTAPQVWAALAQAVNAGTGP